MNNFLREPLLHFLFLGGIIFGVYQQLPSSEGSTTFIVSKQRVQILSDAFQSTWRRPPSTKEINTLIDNYILEELYYREAINLGLDQGDPVIRRRLQQKLEFISKDLTTIIDATDSDLKQFFTDNFEKYRNEPTYSFTQIYIDPAKHSEPLQIAQQWLLEIETIKHSGDPTMLPTIIPRKSLREMNNTFGGELANYVADAELNVWLGPVTSSFGLHLIYVNNIQATTLPTLDDVRSRVNRDWVFQQQGKIKAAMDANIKQKYKILVEHPNYVGN